MTILETARPVDYIRGAGAGQDRCDITEESDLTQNAPAASAATPAPVFPPEAGSADSTDLLSAILASLEDDKAEDILTIPLAGKSEMADQMVIATGRSSRQVQAIAEKLADRLKQDLGRSVRIEGKELGDWVLIDAGDVIVHVFRPEVRDFYQLEKMWMPQGAARPRAVEAG
jgi:ribosome-associated protein